MADIAKEYLDVLGLIRENLIKRDVNLRSCEKKEGSVVGRVECALLQYLYNFKINNGNPDVSMNDLSDFLVVSHSRVTRVMDNLVLGGLVVREHSEVDRRRWFAVLTQKGKDMASIFEMRTLDHQIETISKIPEKDQEAVLKALTLYSDAFNDACKLFTRRR
ncbi:MAG: hypothetical protein B6226_03750 [Candidatus Cloacimonetes bacterium 4572_65]|nr:MAG: hypothetical protein B6226_03750 [Candidatus Cloacimonetes bacterium 4572_65]